MNQDNKSTIKESQLGKQYEYAAQEQEIRSFWEKKDIYKSKFDEKNIDNNFTIDTPPPTVSGSLHIGHIFSYTQTDIIARFKRLMGFNITYPMGFDDNGLATERFVEKTHNTSPREIGRQEFIKLCLEETEKVELEFKSLWQQIGLSVDWNLTYSTISQDTQRISQASFLDLYKKKFIYRKQEPALYCTTCCTTVAQAELDDTEKPSSFNTIIFKLAQDTNQDVNKELLISTTRPELLASCVALFYNPCDSRYKDLKNKKAIVPIYNTEVPILEDELVDPEKGTGLVMCCTFGDKTDIVWYKTHNLPYIQSIDRYGKWTERTGPLAGMRFATARKTILELLEQNNLLKERKDITHAVNTHERCKKEIEYLVLPQWFLSVLPYRQEIIREAQSISWYPNFMFTRFSNWVEHISWDWCLSRQRFYGIPFPVWYCKNCNETLLAKPEDLPVDPLNTKYNGACSCGSTDIEPEPDVMDTWATSSLTPYIVSCKFNKTNLPDFNNPSPFIPMSMRPQAHDIIRTWAFYTITKAKFHSDTIPWKSIVISGHVLSGNKEKLSKSKGNSSLTPQNLLDNYPADAIRYWTASANLGYDLAFSENQLAIGHKLLVKLWNAFRFIFTYLEDKSPNFSELQNNLKEQKIDSQEFGDINRWLLDKASKCFDQYLEAFKKYEFSQALNAIETFFWQTFCDNYLELIKDQLNPEQASYSKESIEYTKATLYFVGLRILQLYSPFVPHITETLYRLLYKDSIGADSIHLTKFSDYQIKYNFEDSVKILNIIQTIVDEVRKLKTNAKLSLKTELENLIIVANQEQQKIIEKNMQLIKGITKAKEIKLLDSNKNSKESQISENNGFEAIIILED